jgi:hypothetical protein
LRVAASQNKPGLFKFAIFKRWVVVPTDMKSIEDVKKATDDVLSNHEPLREVRTVPRAPSICFKVVLVPSNRIHP